MMKKNYILDAWSVLLLSLIFGGMLAGVQSALQPVIEKNKLNDTLGQIPGLVPGAVSGQEENIGEWKVYRALDKDGALVGWVLPGRGQGFADVIEMLVGVNKDATQITGAYVLSQKETPGLGTVIADPKWIGQFTGKPLVRPLEVVKKKPGADHEVEAITGATISSKSVAGIVNLVVEQFRQHLQKGGSI